MARSRPTVLFIVEGISDRTALKKIFQKLYKFKEINFEVTDGDITSDETITVQNVEDKIYKIVKKFMDDKKLSKRDILQIVQIFDTDGTFIENKYIEIGEDTKFEYTLFSIKCKYPQRVADRNKRKSEIMNHLLNVQDIKGITYDKYFMSCNLDHALYNEQNLSDDLKQEYADEFYSTFKDAPKAFVEFLKEEVVNGVPLSYPQSWRYIKEGRHSLERHTNLNIYFDKNPIDILL
ncbi:hypothetical protein GPL15_07570 [Clostridium sp. MCC353]|uniref:hypothetical protein n=1 Tax=Clostridium sp. MCC353 TaxID=2592646 RepID=UPI001C02ECFB|nr:hypothetical protein [Clostridium sp. MCC353]MBT9776359.1 hypothetical protein [Clostridium sp. MCC353]